VPKSAKKELRLSGKGCTPIREARYKESEKAEGHEKVLLRPRQQGMSGKIKPLFT